MSQEIFDQERPRSAMARRLDEAFAGCEQWTLAPPSQRRSEAVFSPQALELREDERQRRRGAHPGAARAVVVGVVEEDDVPGPRRRRLTRRAIDSGGRAPRPVPPPARPEDRPPAAAANRAQRRGAEDPVGRAVVGDRLAARLLDRRPGAFGVLEELTRGEAQEVAVAVAVQLDPVPGGDDLGGQRRSPLDLLAGEEEGGDRAVLAQRLEHGGRPLRVRPVVEGEGDVLAPGGKAHRDAERVAEPGHDRGEGGPGVEDRAGAGGGAEQRSDQGPSSPAPDSAEDTCRTGEALETEGADSSLSLPMWMRPSSGLAITL